MPQNESRIVVSTYGFNVPCRRFLITANITRDRRLPVVDEFVLRVLKTAEAVPVKALATYFGFAKSEMDVVLTDLAARSLVELHDDLVRLHGSAHGLFRGDPDGSPYMMETEPSVERLWFDLVSGNMMNPSRWRPAPHLLELEGGKITRDLSPAFARRAFEDNFVEFLRTVRKIQDPSRFSLYSVSAVEPEMFATAVVQTRDELVLGSLPSIEPVFIDVSVELRGRFQNLSGAMANSYRRLNSPEPSRAAFEDFARLTGRRLLPSEAASVMQFKLASWFHTYSSDIDKQEGQRAVVGASYVTQNIDAFVDLMERRASRPTQASPTWELIWFRPAGSRWGASPDLGEALKKLRGVVRQIASKDVDATSILVVPLSVKKEGPRRFKRLFDQCYVAAGGYLSPAVEVVLLRGVGAMVLAEAPVSTSSSVPIGVCVVDREGLDRIEKGLRLEQTLATTPLWSDSAVAEEGAIVAPPASIEREPSEG